MKKTAAILLMVAMILLLAACAVENEPAGTGSTGETPTPSSAGSDPGGEPADGQNLNIENAEEENTTMQMKIGDTAVSVEWESNESVEALDWLCRDQPLTIQMSMYGGFEQVGSLGQSLPRDDVQTTTSAGDIVLYSGDQIVVFYGSNSWMYTRLGKITDQTADDMARLLGNGDVTVTISGRNAK